MLIGICGAKCAGKKTVAQYLVEHHGFKRLYLKQQESATGQNGISEPKVDGTEPPAEKGSATRSIIIRPANGISTPHTFASESELLDFVTKHWRSRWVTTDIHSETVLDTLSRRPFFILISVDAPVIVRWRRHFAQQQQQTQTTTSSSDLASDHEFLTLEDFVSESDTQLYSPTNGALQLMSRATIRLLNTSDSLAHFYATLGKLDLTDNDRLRPGWDSYFMALASLAARRCNCMKRAVGCVLVDGKRRVISTGYNGTPRTLPNCMDGGCPRCNEPGVASGAALATCLCLHAEENALLEAGRERIRDGSVLYCNTCPCLTCSIKIVQVGISEVVYNQGYSMDRETARVFLSAGVRLRQFSPPADGLIHLERMD